MSGVEKRRGGGRGKPSVIAKVPRAWPGAYSAATVPSSANWTSVTYGNGTFVAVAAGSNRFCRSADGMNWTATTAPSATSWKSVTYGDGTFVAVSSGWDVATSSDGMIWSDFLLSFPSDPSDPSYIGNPTSVAIDDTSGNIVVVTSDGKVCFGEKNPPVASVTTSGNVTTNYSSFAEAANSTNWPAGSTLKLLADVEITATINVPNGAHTLDLNDHSLTGSGAGSVISVSGGALTITDSASGKTTRYYTVSGETVPSHLTTAGAVDAVGSFAGGYITGGGSGGLAISSGAVTMNGGTVFANRAASGGGASVTGTGSLTMNAGAGIIGNFAGSAAGAVYVSGGTFTMNGGSVRHNYCADAVGAIDVVDGTIELKGGEIRNNTEANEVSGGIRIQSGSFRLSGGAEIHHNYSNNGTYLRDVRLADGRTITITGPLTMSNPIKVSKAGGGAFTSSADPSWNDASKFTGDNSLYTVCKNADGQLLLGVPNVQMSAGGATDYYLDLADAIAAANKAGGTVTLTLLDSVTLSSTAVIGG